MNDGVNLFSVSNADPDEVYKYLRNPYISDGVTTLRDLQVVWARAK